MPDAISQCKTSLIKRTIMLGLSEDDVDMHYFLCFTHRFEMAFTLLEEISNFKNQHSIIFLFLSELNFIEVFPSLYMK